jgi:hypothetical protein
MLNGRRAGFVLALLAAGCGDAGLADDRADPTSVDTEAAKIDPLGRYLIGKRWGYDPPPPFDDDCTESDCTDAGFFTISANGTFKWEDWYGGVARGNWTYHHNQTGTIHWMTFAFKGNSPENAPGGPGSPFYVAFPLKPENKNRVLMHYLFSVGPRLNKLGSWLDHRAWTNCDVLYCDGS